VTVNKLSHVIHRHLVKEIIQRNDCHIHYGSPSRGNYGISSYCSIHL